MIRGTAWHCLAVICVLAAARAQAQDPAPADASRAPVAPAAPAEPPSDEAPIPSPAVETAPPEVAPPTPPTEVAPVELAVQPEAPVAGPEDVQPVAPPRVAGALSSPILTERPPARAAADPEPPAAPVSTEPRPRGWRLPRETVRRPLTLPQGALRFDSTLTMSVAPIPFGSRFYMSGFAAVAAGLFDDFEIGTTPLGVTWIPFGAYLSDPSVYARVRVHSGDVQVAFRAGTTLPVASQIGVARMELATELAFLVTPIFRIDTGVDYGLLFSSPLHQRIGIPLTGTVQLASHAIGLTLGVYVFNDFDDVDVPLLLRYTVAFPGYQGPIGEWSCEGGFVDLENAENAWTIQSRFTFFAYL